MTTTISGLVLTDAAGFELVGADGVAVDTGCAPACCGGGGTPTGCCTSDDPTSPPLAPLNPEAGGWGQSFCAAILGSNSTPSDPLRSTFRGCLRDLHYASTVREQRASQVGGAIDTDLTYELTIDLVDGPVRAFVPLAGGDDLPCRLAFTIRVEVVDRVFGTVAGEAYSRQIAYEACITVAALCPMTGTTTKAPSSAGGLLPNLSGGFVWYDLPVGDLRSLLTGFVNEYDFTSGPVHYVRNETPVHAWQGGPGGFSGQSSWTVTQTQTQSGTLQYQYDETTTFRMAVDMGGQSCPAPAPPAISPPTCGLSDCGTETDVYVGIPCDRSRTDLGSPPAFPVANVTTCRVWTGASGNGQTGCYIITPFNPRVAVGDLPVDTPIVNDLIDSNSPLPTKAPCNCLEGCVTVQPIRDPCQAAQNPQAVERLDCCCDFDNFTAEINRYTHEFIEYSGGVETQRWTATLRVPGQRVVANGNEVLHQPALCDYTSPSGTQPDLHVALFAIACGQTGWEAPPTGDGPPWISFGQVCAGDFRDANGNGIVRVGGVNTTCNGFSVSIIETSYVNGVVDRYQKFTAGVTVRSTRGKCQRCDCQTTGSATTGSGETSTLVLRDGEDGGGGCGGWGGDDGGL